MGEGGRGGLKTVNKDGKIMVVVELVDVDLPLYSVSCAAVLNGWEGGRESVCV